MSPPPHYAPTKENATNFSPIDTLPPIPLPTDFVRPSQMMAARPRVATTHSVSFDRNNNSHTYTADYASEKRNGIYNVARDMALEAHLSSSPPQSDLHSRYGSYGNQSSPTMSSPSSPRQVYTNNQYYGEGMVSSVLGSDSSQISSPHSPKRAHSPKRPPSEDLYIMTIPSPPHPTSHHSSETSTSEPSIYVFQSTGFNTLALAPSNSLHQPLYHITVNMNCFMPTSYITTVRRYGSEGEVVGEFEMGFSADKPTVTYKGRYYRMEDILFNFRKAVDSKLKDRLRWERDNVHLQWDGTGEVGSRCFDNDDKAKKTLARIVPPTEQSFLSGQPKITQLEIHPAGIHLIDDIVFSSLIVERRRLTPRSKESDKATFFNAVRGLAAS
ncbi:hypothetical protein C8Q75DRAFT_807882 [Abortiporus biennis]|nr:hypothetical protein C8Q75DRAFT_807882 [Abortiporus biennis]